MNHCRPPFEASEAFSPQLAHQPHRLHWILSRRRDVSLRIACCTRDERSHSRRLDTHPKRLERLHTRQSQHVTTWHKYFAECGARRVRSVAVTALARSQEFRKTPAIPTHPHTLNTPAGALQTRLERAGSLSLGVFSGLKIPCPKGHPGSTPGSPIDLRFWSTSKTATVAGRSQRSARSQHAWHLRSGGRHVFVAEPVVEFQRRLDGRMTCQLLDRRER